MKYPRADSQPNIAAQSATQPCCAREDIQRTRLVKNIFQTHSTVFDSATKVANAFWGARAFSTFL
jgi:hypothetical protein